MVETATSDFPPPTTWRLLVPGFAQWGSGQRERALVLTASYVASVAVGCFLWGTGAGLALLLVAFVIHSASTVDAVRRNAFPSQGRWATLSGVLLGLFVSVYGPFLAAASVMAWPGVQGGSYLLCLDGYLVNRLAYQFSDPCCGDWVWYRPGPGCVPRVGRVVAERGQDVEWTGSRLRVDGRDQLTPAPARAGWAPPEIAYRVPEGHVLIRPTPGGDPKVPPVTRGVVIVSHEQIVGRAWARMYPVGERQLLR